jgi:hypothetical protein
MDYLHFNAEGQARIFLFLQEQIIPCALYSRMVFLKKWRHRLSWGRVAVRFGSGPRNHPASMSFLF